MSSRWDELVPGAETGSVEFVVTDEMIDEYVGAMEIAHPWFTSANTPYHARIAPPDMICKLAMTPLFQEYIRRELGPNMRARQAFKFFAPIRAGMTVKATGHLTEKYERRGKHFVTLEALFTDEQGNPLVLDKRTQYLPEPAAAA